MACRRLLVTALAASFLLVSLPACSDNRPENKVVTTETMPVLGPPAGSGGPAKGKKSQLPAKPDKVD